MYGVLSFCTYVFLYFCILMFILFFSSFIHASSISVRYVFISLCISVRVYVFVC